MEHEGPIPLFDGVKVVEIGQYIAAPYAAEFFAHGGAEVTSIEPVDGGPTRHNSPLGPPGDGRQYVIKARGKRSLPLTLSSKEGQEIVHRLLADADVLITNLRPALAGRLGLGWDQLRIDHPALIFAEVRGFGDSGPLAEAACVDIVAQAASGLMRSLGRREDGRSRPTDVMIADYTAGCLLAFGIAAALRFRDQTGVGQRVSTSLVAACLTAQHRRASRVDSVDTEWHDELTARARSLAAPSSATDLDELTAWRDEQIGTSPFFYNCYAVADGEVAVGAVAANGPRLLEVVGLDPGNLVDVASFEGLTVGETSDLVAASFSSWEAEPLVAALRAAGVPASKVQFLEEALIDEELALADLLHQFDHPRLGMMTMPAPPVKFDVARFEPAHETPAFGANTDELLRDLGYEEEIIERLVADGIVGRADALAEGRSRKEGSR